MAVLAGAGFPIGLTDDVYEERSVNLAAGDRLYLYSDGAPETMDIAGSLFGDSRLREAIQHGRPKPLREGLAILLQAIAEWRGAAHLQDDLSILAIEVQSTPGQDLIQNGDRL